LLVSLGEILLADEAMNGAGMPAPTAFDAAHYIRHLTGELHGIAVQGKFGFLAYLLKMAEEEAANLSERLEGHRRDMR
jgi:hypothetical protein